MRRCDFTGAETDMRRTWIGAAVVAAVALSAAGSFAAQQGQPAQPSIMEPDEPDQAAPPAKPTRHARKATTRDIQPDLDTDDQLAPSQIKQPIPAAVAEPSGGTPRKQTPPGKNATADAPSA